MPPNECGTDETPMANPQIKRTRRSTAKRVALLAAGVLVVSLLVASYVVLRTPGWYRPPVIAVADRQAVRNNLIQAEQAFTEGLRDGEPFTYHLYAEDINRWITMRKEIYPLIDELAPPILVDPFVHFDEDTITVAGKLETAAADLLISIEIELMLDQGDLVLRASTMRCGSAPIPMDDERLGLATTIQNNANDLWPGSPAMAGDFLSGLRIGAEAWWKNGGVAYRIEAVELHPGRLDIHVRPLGRPGDKGRKRHAAP